ncbi:acetyl-CoA carboxylase biotin carboxylase subunit [Puteibacter caeruleilacunae]|nr:acetyl-CoA carboxylase biotin carboxylase subunit [Puteibacter caeruleilacunae]
MKIKRLLIANRGEIAVRIIKSAKALGIETVVIKTSAEPSAIYVREADIVHDDTDDVSEIPVFLDIERLIEIALEHEVDAVHPGYGFLAENAYFAQKCMDNRLMFIGPSPDAIYKLGNKTIARQIALRNKVPMATGSRGTIRSTDEAIKVAERIGYPVIVKAASGGGGRGMRIAWNEEELPQMLRLAQNEAEKAFNDPNVFIEKYIANPKHIEFQILGDTKGDVIHLGERECSIQRKHQKLLEEAPSSALSPELREEMGEVAVRLAKAVRYHSAGTVEFLLDSNGEYYFMEMNTRIQVEHPVTELITGVDLIEKQIRIAAGEPLGLTQDDIKLNGWAIECRINAEDVQAGFAPSPGMIEKLSFPDMDFVRVDSGIEEGSAIASNFDSMIAKLIVSGENRDEAIANCRKALDKVWVKGIKTTIPFFKLLMKHPVFVGGDFTTGFIENDLEQYHEAKAEEEQVAAWFATKLFVEEKTADSDATVDFEQGKKMDPWLLNKRLNQF